MAVYRNISLTFWTDRKIDEEFSPQDKYFYLYLLSNPHTNICGCYEISFGQMERETGYDTKTIKGLIDRLENVHNVIRYDKKTKEVFIINFSKYNWSNSEKVKKAIIRVGETIKSPNFKKYIMKLVEKEISTKDIPPITVTVTETVTVTDTVSETETETDTGAVTDTETDTDTDTVVSIGYTYPMHTLSPSPPKFIKPSLKEVEAYCKERNNKVDAEKFLDYYESNGWRVGKNPMKDWKATVRRWEKTEYSDSSTPSQPELTQGADGFWYDKDGERYV